MASVMAVAAVCLDPESVPIWCMAITSIINFIWENNKSLPYVAAMLAPAIFQRNDMYSAAQFMAGAAYIFFFFSLECGEKDPLVPPPPPVPKPELTTNPVNSIEIDDV